MDQTQNKKSKFLSDAEFAQQKLDTVSPSFCLAKWKQVSLHLTNGWNNSCYHPPLHPIDPGSLVDNPGALHNTDHKKQQRKMMLEGIRPPECSYCWAMEDNGKLSDRHYRSGEPWAMADFERIVASDWDSPIIPSYVEVNFNNVCNLRCSYCSPQFSSSWMAESQQHGAFPTSTPHNDPDHFQGRRRPIPNREHNPYVEAFWRWWPDLYPHLKHFRMTGGEPLMDRNTYRVFDYVLEHPKPDLHLNVTSNFSVEPAMFDRYIGYLKKLCTEDIEHFMQYVSVDTWGKQAEYIRDGLNFDRMIGNVETYLDEIPYRNSLTFIITMNNLVVPGLQQLLEYILELRERYSHTYQKIWFDTPVLHTPAWQSLQILTPAYVSALESVAAWMESKLETPDQPFRGFKDYEVQRLRRDIAWMKSAENQDNSQHCADFYRFFSEHDRRRGTDFLSTFPTMASWWNLCEQHAKKT